MTLLERLYEAAAPRLCGKRVQDVRIGSHLVGVLLDSGEFGAAYALPGERQTPEPVFLDPARYVGMPAETITEGTCPAIRCASRGRMTSMTAFFDAARSKPQR